MGAELGATTTVFPADDEIRGFMRSQDREDEYEELVADEGCEYDKHDEIDLSTLVPLIAKPTSPGNVVPVEELAGEDLYQAYVGSSANPGYRDFAIAAEMVRGRQVSKHVSFDVNPSSRAMLQTLARDDRLGQLIASGARIHQAGCNGCIGMGQAPASGRNSLRTTPRNFPGRSGTKEDSVFLCSPETAVASALMGKITDPRTLDFDYPKVGNPDDPVVNDMMLEAPLPLEEARKVELVKGPNIKSLPDFDGIPDAFELPVLLKVGDDISTDEIMRAGAEVLPFRSNIPAIAEFVYDVVDEEYPKRAKNTGDHVIIGGSNYGQGSSREHAAIAPRYLGLRAVIAKDYARIHWQNLVNFGVLPLIYSNGDDHESLKQGAKLSISGLHAALAESDTVTVEVKGGEPIECRHGLSPRQVEILMAGGLINWKRDQG
tara:strand:- start:63 stop:1358 length:1296 start_codon:yes stop_codon:yes gene_type:complete